MAKQQQCSRAPVVEHERRRHRRRARRQHRRRQPPRSHEREHGRQRERAGNASPPRRHAHDDDGADQSSVCQHEDVAREQQIHKSDHRPRPRATRRATIMDSGVDEQQAEGSRQDERDEAPREGETVGDGERRKHPPAIAAQRGHESPGRQHESYQREAQNELERHRDREYQREQETQRVRRQRVRYPVDLEVVRVGEPAIRPAEANRELRRVLRQVDERQEVSHPQWDDEQAAARRKTQPPRIPHLRPGSHAKELRRLGWSS